ncbi:MULTISPECIES: glycosyltransferase [unclassified Sphingobacterium]|uniref:glycosyltransferase n=1 Tax=unclassified Sphingobacterium TaxID=2609468 RepID=UPI0025D4D85E|nr:MULTISPECIES: glycosyltransferase [unclassified Sphingobacterium]
MDKICFIILRYGDEVDGGAEKHCRMLAERLVGGYEVDILTTKFIDYNTFVPFYKNDIDYLNGVRILRFGSIDFDSRKRDILWKKALRFQKIRRNLFRLKSLKLVSELFPSWKGISGADIDYFKSHGSYSPSMLSYINNNHQHYKAIIGITYSQPNTFFGALIAPEKSILIPTLHEEREAFRPILTQLFSKVKHIAFNTEEERNLAFNIFGSHIANNSIVAVGVEVSTPLDKETLYSKFQLPKNYLLYFGRVCNTKVRTLIPWFLRYKQKYPSDLKLVLTGRIFMDKTEHPDVIYTDFVTEEEKTALIENARAVINPSQYESLSLLLLETMVLGKPILVNGKSKVMKEHCIKSNYAAQYYSSESDFQRKLCQILEGDVSFMRSISISYVENNYSWPLVIKKLTHIIDSI